MRILFLLSDEHGGAGIAAIRQAEALRSLGHEVHIESLNSSHHPKKILRARVIIARANRIYERRVLKKQGLLSEKFLRSLFWLPFYNLHGLSLRNYDFIHFHWVGNGFVGLNHITRIAKKNKIAITFHSTWPFTGIEHHLNPIERYIPNSKRDIKSINNFLKTDCVRIVPSSYVQKIAENSVTTNIIHNCLPIEVPAYTRREGSKTLLFISSGSVMDPRKGFDEIRNCWSQVHEKHPEWKLLVVGPIWEHSLNKTDRLKYANQGMVFIGKQEPLAVFGLSSLVEGLIVASKAETFGMVLMEALSAGLPIIVNRNLPTIKEFDSLKFAIKPISITSRGISAGINFLESGEFDRKLIRKTALSMFSAEKVGQELINLYSDLRESNN